MPSVSKKQHNLMAMVANNPAKAKELKIPQKVGEDFVKADKGLKFGTGNRPDLQKINKPKTDHGKEAIFKKGGVMKQDKLKSLFKGKESYSEELKEAKAIKSGKITPQEYAKGEKMEGHKKGGRIASKGEHSVQKQSKRGAEVVKMARGGGIEVRGKTKGTMVKMCGGGMMKGKK